jgi:hypothetical protein
MNWRVFVAVFLMPALALAEPPLPAPEVVTYPPGDDKIVVVKKGDAAPYQGQLFDDSTALRWAVWLQQYKARYGLDMQAERARAEARLQYVREVAAIDAKAAAAKEADLRARLKAVDAARLKLEEEVRNPSFFKQPGVWFGIGILTTVVTAGTTVALLNATK